MEPSLTEPVLQGMCWKKQTSNLLHSLRCCRLWAMISPLTFLLFVVFTFSLFHYSLLRLWGFYLISFLVLSTLPFSLSSNLFTIEFNYPTTEGDLLLEWNSCTLFIEEVFLFFLCFLKSLFSTRIWQICWKLQLLSFL